MQISGPLLHMTGGPRYTIQSLCNNLAVNHNVEIKFIGSELDQQLEWHSDLIDYCKIPASKYPFTMQPYRKIEKDIIGEVDICHSHGLWGRANYVASVIAKDLKHVITTRGMLTKWAFNNSRLKKIAAWHLFQKKTLRRAVCLHATSEAEASDLRDMGLTNPIAVIPNGVDIPEYASAADRSRLTEYWPELEGRKILLFMSRIHKKKGLDMLAEIWGELSVAYPEWHLVIAGPDQADYWKEINSRIVNNGSADSVLYLGPQYGPEKEVLLSCCDVFILPTYSENFGVAVAEALAFAKPVITTTGAPWRDLLKHNCGWWVDPEASAIKKTLISAMDTAPDNLEKMGLAGRAMVREKYSWDAISSQVYDLYRWLLGDIERPDYVIV